MDVEYTLFLSTAAECLAKIMTWSRPRKEHEVQAVGSVPLRFVQGRSLLHQVLQVPGVHLQPSDHVVQVAFIVLVVNFAEG